VVPLLPQIGVVSDHQHHGVSVHAGFPGAGSVSKNWRKLL